MGGTQIKNVLCSGQEINGYSQTVALYCILVLGILEKEVVRACFCISQPYLVKSIVGKSNAVQYSSAVLKVW